MTRSGPWSPAFAYWPILILATAATVIASQAVITGAFSMTQQAVQLGLFPRMDIKRTSRDPGRPDLSCRSSTSR